ncbi:hypothetical protein ACT8ZS_13785 [Paenibacillus sp. M.A.Huq-84]
MKAAFEHRFLPHHLSNIQKAAELIFGFLNPTLMGISLQKRRFHFRFHSGFGGVFDHNLGLIHSLILFWDSLFLL